MSKSFSLVYRLAVVFLAVAISRHVEASLVISSAVGDAPSGAITENFDSLPVGTSSMTMLPSGMTISFDGASRAVSGSVASLYAAPFLSGSNGLGFGASGGNQSNGMDASTYVAVGKAGSATLQFSTPMTYLGLLWGSVDAYNMLSFYNGATLIGTVTGSDVIANPNGDQGANGTVYANINATSGSSFDRVIATSDGNAFEFDDVAFNLDLAPQLSSQDPDPIPEPMSLSLAVTGMLGLGVIRLRRRPPHWRGTA
jgi:hypothetical protein